MVLGALFTSCQREGCTDTLADNYDSEAQKDDGSCIVSGCTDPEANNYWYYATRDNATCRYNGTVKGYSTLTLLQNPFRVLFVEINGEVYGRIQSPCAAEFVACNTSCDLLEISELEHGTHFYRTFLCDAKDTLAYDTLQVGSFHTFQVAPKSCGTIEFLLN